MKRKLTYFAPMQPDGGIADILVSLFDKEEDVILLDDEKIVKVTVTWEDGK